MVELQPSPATLTTSQSLVDRLNLLKSSSRSTVIVGSSGSVASIKTLQLCQKVLESNYNVVLVATEKSLPFLTADMQMNEDLPVDQWLRAHWEKLDPEQPLQMWFSDQDEWEGWKQRADPVLHIELRKLAKLLVIAPLSANTMAKIANGLCDNLLTCIVRCWDFSATSEQKVIVAPAMNTFMYVHPITEIQEKFLRETLRITVLPTVEKTLMCGDTGKGAMASVETIKEAIDAFFA